MWTSTFFILQETLDLCLIVCKVLKAIKDGVRNISLCNNLIAPKFCNNINICSCVNNVLAFEANSKAKFFNLWHLTFLVFHMPISLTSIYVILKDIMAYRYLIFYRDFIMKLLFENKFISSVKGTPNVIMKQIKENT